MSKIILNMIVVFFIFSGILYLMKPELGWYHVLETNIALFIPVFGDKNNLIDSLNLNSIQSIILKLEILFFYIFWIMLAVSVRRNFRR